MTLAELIVSGSYSKKVFNGALVYPIRIKWLDTKPSRAVKLFQKQQPAGIFWICTHKHQKGAKQSYCRLLRLYIDKNSLKRMHCSELHQNECKVNDFKKVTTIQLVACRESKCFFYILKQNVSQEKHTMMISLAIFRNVRFACICPEC